ncbi:MULTISPECIES: hypothetical protein [Flavobacteriaceae]|uniref:hypothetical protein n=1 Tax=Flavobacteriaceae TaxID=49546 RepID=UPI00234B6DC8|nr:hypothetical protein [Muricauda sp. SP22]MDC6363639.1 hypothetical protein [Muricauda sp. SP22]
MKKYTISLIASVVSIAGIAQNSNPKIDRDLLKTGKAVIINSEYLNKVQDDHTSESIKEFHLLVSSLDITKTKSFDKRKSLFEIVCKSDKGSIIAFYNSKGEIEATYENFENIALPKKTMINILKDHPGSTIMQTKSSLNYSKDFGLQRQYRVLLFKNEDKEWVKLDAS